MLSLKVYLFLCFHYTVESVRYGEVDEVVTGGRDNDYALLHGEVNLCDAVASLPHRQVLDTTLALKLQVASLIEGAHESQQTSIRAQEEN